MRLATVAVLCALTTSNVFAKDMTLSTFLATRDTPQTMGYISGLGMAYTYSNSYLQLAGFPMMYCQPSRVALNGENFADLIEQEVKSPSGGYVYGKNDAVGGILLKSLILQFPCSR